MPDSRPEESFAEGPVEILHGCFAREEISAEELEQARRTLGA